jgi:hypothetical protein
LISLAFSDAVQPRTVHKFTRPVRILLQGEPTAEDRTAAGSAAADLKDLTKLDIAVVTAAGEENVSIFFVPAADFSKYEPRVQAGAKQWFSIKPPAGGAAANDIGSATVLVDSSLNLRQKAVAVHGLLAHAIGLVNSSNTTYPESVLSSTPSIRTAPTYSELDKAVIQLFYSDTVKLGMDEAQLRAALGR